VKRSLLPYLKSRRGATSAALLLAATLFAAAGTAHAIANSGWVWWGDGNTPEGCRGGWLWAEISTITANGGIVYPWNYGQVEFRQCVPGGAPSSVAAGFIGASVDGFRNGGYCGTSGYKYNSSRASRVTNSVIACSNPSGLQGYHTLVGGLMWGGNGYWFFGPQGSPSQSY